MRKLSDIAAEVGFGIVDLQQNVKETLDKTDNALIKERVTIALYKLNEANNFVERARLDLLEARRLATTATV